MLTENIEITHVLYYMTFVLKFMYFEFEVWTKAYII